MKKPRNHRAKQPTPVNFDPGLLIDRLYRDLVEIEAIAVTADEAVTMLPPNPSGKTHRQTLSRLYVLVSQTSSKANAALERSQELVALHDAHLAAIRAARRSPARRAR